MDAEAMAEARRTEIQVEEERMALSSPSPFSFGVIADVQYADIEDGTSFDGKQHRHYRASLVALHAAVECWNGWPTRLSFVAQLGDAIDGLCARQAPRQSERCAAAVANVLMDGCTAVDEFHHLVGNHELYNFPRESLRDGPAALRCTASEPYSYHSFQPVRGWRVLCLDAYEISAIGWPAEHPNSALAWGLLDANNPNDCRKSSDWLAGLNGLERRYVPYGGGVGAEQLAWIRAEMVAAREAGERVVAMSHVALKPGACVASCVIFNYAEVLDALSAGGLGRCCVVLAGHDHNGGYTLDEHGTHHVTLPSPLVAPPPQPCHAVIEVRAGVVRVHGFGTMPSRELNVFGLGGEGRRDAALAAMEHRRSVEKIIADAVGAPLHACKEALERVEGCTDAAVRTLAGKDACDVLETLRGSFSSRQLP